MKTKTSVTVHLIDGSKEWVHEEGYSVGTTGVTLQWGEHGAFFPWAAILRVDVEGSCDCVRCREAERITAAVGAVTGNPAP